MSDTIYSQIISKLRRGDLTPAQQAELDAIRLIGDIDLNDTFWIQFLPMYFLTSRADDEIINTTALFEAIQASGGGRRGGAVFDLDALAEGVAARLEDQLLNLDPVVLARAVAKAATPAIQQAAENVIANAIQQPKVDLTPLQPVIKETLQQTQAVMRETCRDAMLNRNVVIVALAGVLMCGIGVWWGGQQSDARWNPVVQQLRDQVKHLDAGANTGRLHGDTAVCRHHLVGGICG